MRNSQDAARPERRLYQRAGLWLGPVVAGVLLCLDAPAGMTGAAWYTVAVATLMAVWWATEAIPLAVTALLPLGLFPLLGVADMKASAAPYAHPLIYLFLGGFLLAVALQRWGLHERIALGVLSRLGSRPGALVGGFMAATAMLSMWVSNTATALMMLPIATSVSAVVAGDLDERSARRFSIALMLSIAYAASIGGLGTLVGTPPNALLAAFLEQTYGIELGFARWMLIGVPVVAVMLPLAWLVLIRVFPVSVGDSNPGARALLVSKRDELGRVTPEQMRVGVIFLCTALAWIGRPLIVKYLGVDGLTDSGIAIAGAVLLFLVPARNGGSLLDWETAREVPWGILLLFGGGLSLAQAVNQTGLADWIGERMSGWSMVPLALMVVLLVVLVIFLTEMTSNTATAAAFLPVVGSLAVSLGEGPALFAVPAALAASCAFMLPVATPPNAIVFASGAVTVPQMVRAGLVMNLIGVIVLSGIAWFLVPLVL